MTRASRSPRSSPSRIKKQIRQQVLAARDKLSPAEIEDRSRAIFIRVVQSWEFQQSSTLMLYADFGSEVRTGLLQEAALREGKTLVFPRVNRELWRMELYRVEDPAAQLAPGIWGIREPDPAVCGSANMVDLDCVIAPGVAFDPWGGRTGYGGGFYDRLLNSLSPQQAALCLGLAFECQIVYEVPRNFFDAHVSALATELRLIENR